MLCVATGVISWKRTQPLQPHQPTLDRLNKAMLLNNHPINPNKAMLNNHLINLNKAMLLNNHRINLSHLKAMW